MSMIKVLPVGCHEEVLRGEPQTKLVKWSSGGLVGDDFRSLVKRAGHHVSEMMRGLSFGKGEVPAHQIALGAEEAYGMNRNGDAFKEACCQKYHSTFEKYARLYRDHDNKDPAKSYGTIKRSFYNPSMRRIELIVAYNGTKEAAEKNKGLVADKELEKLGRGDDIGVSMSCKVPFDVCSGCGNHARTRSEYCSGTDEGGHCKRGGLKNRITKVDDDGFQLYADNPDPVWFDQSSVWRPADRIAYSNGICKVAGVEVLGGAALAEALGVTAPLELDVTPGGRLTKLAARLARLEGGQLPEFYNSVRPEGRLQTGSWHDHGTDFRLALVALATEKIAMPLEGFLSMALGRPVEEELVAGVEAVRGRLPGIYGRILAQGEAEKAADFRPARGRTPPPKTREWARKLASDYSLDRRHLARRCLRAGLAGPADRRPTLVKEGSAGKFHEELARAYAFYKLAFLEAQEGQKDFDLICSLAVEQNYR